MKTSASKISLAIRLSAFLLVVFCIAGCSPTAEPKGIWAKLWGIEVGPDYKRPEVKPVEDFRSQIGPSEATSLADLGWWQVFNDKALQGLIVTALEHNYDLELAADRVEQSRALVGVAASQLYPQIGYQGFAGREKVFTPLQQDVEQGRGNITFNAFGGLLNLAWELDVWGRIRRSTEAARANLFAQEYVRRGVMLTLVSDVAASYFSVLELDRELAIAQESSRTYKQTLDLFTQRYKFGRDSKLPVARAQAAYASSIASVASLKRAIVQQENAISILLGAYPEEIPRGVQLTEQAAPRTPLGLTTDVMQRRPDILQAEQNALCGAQSPNMNHLLDNSFSIWNIAGGLAGPIFQGGQILETYYAQQALWEGTIVQYKQSVIVAFREVSDALIAQTTLVDQRGALEGQVASLREAVELSLLRYNAGRASYFEVLEAEQLLFPAEDALAQSQRDQLLVVVALYKALGGGWNLSDTQWTQAH